MMEKTLTSATGSRRLQASLQLRDLNSRRDLFSGRGSGRASGFSLVELLVALAIAGMIMALAAPASVRFYEGIQRRQAVRDTVTLLASAREQALSSGRYQDVMVRPATRVVWREGKEHQLPDGLSVTVHGAAELNHRDVGVIRFYPDGSASGGGIDIARSDGSGTRINVDWLIGSVQQLSLDEL